MSRALQALGIHHLVAESPPAKGRSARRWTTLQDRLVAELARAGLPPLATGDAFLVTPGLPACTTQFAGPPPGAVSASRPVPRSRDLDRACAFHSARPVALENPVRGADVVLHLPPGPPRRSSARAPADVVQCLDGSWRVYVGDRLVAATSAPLDPGQLRARTRR